MMVIEDQKGFHDDIAGALVSVDKGMVFYNAKGIRRSEGSYISLRLIGMDILRTREFQTRCSVDLTP